MDIRDYVRIARGHWIFIAALTLTGLLLGAGAAVAIKPTYTSELQLFVAIQSSGTVQELQQGNTFTQARVQSYVKTVGSPIVLQPAIETLGLNVTPDQLAAKVRATTDLNTVLINISVSDSSPVQAQAITQAVGNSLIRAVELLEKPKSGGSSPVALSIIKPATTPSAPSAPNTPLYLLLGTVIGFAVGAGGAILRSLLDNRVNGETDLRRVTEAPVLGRISFDQEAMKNPLLTQTSPQSPRAESFRQLRTNLQFANISGRAKTMVITSSLPGEGKSTTATNLAISLAQAGQTVCLIDADLRRPMVGEYLGLERSAGLTTALVGSADVDDLLQQWGDGNLYVLTSGRIPPNPSELLGSAEMSELINRLEQVFDAVIIDAPPLLPVTDSAVLAQHVGGIVMVVRSQKLKQHDLEKALSALQMVEANLLGVVLNGLPAKGPDSYTYGYYSQDTQPDAAIPETRYRTSGSQHALLPDSDYSPEATLSAEMEQGPSRPATNFPILPTNEALEGAPPRK
ncbi:capsular exopolysaccharide synthesis family protein [Pseudarthrobacter sp. W1I19]|uniref:polysaccharide biosynthesis tyrosine autokinase n=1 Tax=Pseudarthrobacter sp. W1I19 TaxID=3042288 RepID=UPI00278AD59F|nr:polysaccharide biosynthesis tyrosine autokinase [Pseudarthrobacter sp. W1I19]MDQ0922304.1 capsular exopolysaccharide synthesis family protein [Pseudarthrobacter sp. W1I19]